MMKTQSYDTVNNAWSTIDQFTQLPADKAIYSTAAAAVENTIFWFGGQGAGGSTVNTIASFDTLTPLGAWSFPSTLSTANTQMSAVTVGKLIYITGGLNGLTSTRIYDTDTPTAQPSTPPSLTLTIPRASHASFLNPSDNKIYLVGGITFFPDRDKTVEALNLNAPSPVWTAVPSAALNLLNTASSGGLIGSRFYFAGITSTNGGSSSVLSVLELSGTPHWIPFASSPTPVTNMAVGKIGSSIITAGGGSQSGVTDQTNIYDISSDSWSTATASLSPTTASQASAVVGSEMFSIGGSSSGAAVKTTKVLSNDRTSWDARKDLNVARLGLCAAAEGTKIFAFGGRSESTPLDTMEIYETDPAQTSTFNTWRDVTASSKGPNNPTPVYNCAAVSTGTKILIFGGVDSGGATDKIQSFDIGTEKWDPPISITITSRSSLSATVLNGFVILSGGSSDSSTSLGKVEAFKISTGEVFSLPDMPTPRFGHGSFVDDNAVFFVGGFNGDLIAPLEKYRPSLPA